MDTDIEARLRAYALTHAPNEWHREHRELLHEAADTIERLRAEIERLWSEHASELVYLEDRE